MANVTLAWCGRASVKLCTYAVLNTTLAAGRPARIPLNAQFGARGRVQRTRKRSRRTAEAFPARSVARTAIR